MAMVYFDGNQKELATNKIVPVAESSQSKQDFLYFPSPFLVIGSYSVYQDSTESLILPFFKISHNL